MGEELQARPALESLSVKEHHSRAREIADGFPAVEDVEVRGHIIDSLILPKVLDGITAAGGKFEITDIAVGHDRADPSFAHIKVRAVDEAALQSILAQIADHGAVPIHGGDARLVVADMDGAFPEGFYSTTNQRTEVRLDGHWLPVADQEMDCGIIVDVQSRECRCVPMSDVERGVQVVVGYVGVRVFPLERQEQGHAFAFMNSAVSTEKPKGVVIREIARQLFANRRDASKTLLVGGPAIVHTGSGPLVCQLIRDGYIHKLFAGNALATHDIEQALFGTSLGVNLSEGTIVDAGHEHHLRAINRIRRAGSIAAAVDSGLLRDFDGNTNNTLFAANDGGIYKTDEASDEVRRGITALCNPDLGEIAWQQISGNLGITQFYHGAVFPNGREYIAGAQDNGTLLGRDDRGANGWTLIAGGDGSYAAINPLTPGTFYVSSQGAYILKTEDGGSTFKPAIAGLADEFLFITPLMIDRGAPQVLWTGGRKLWRTDNAGVNWTAASTTLGAGKVSAIAVSGPRVLAGTSNGFIYRNADARSATPTTTWPGVQPRAGFVSSITHHPHQEDVVYATFAGFGGQHVWKSTNGGVSWAPLDGEGDGQIPDIPVHSLVVDPHRPERLFIGTDLGVMVSIDGGAHWMTEADGMPNAVTEWLVIADAPEGRSLYAFTHGRGVWRAKLPNATRRRSIRHAGTEPVHPTSHPVVMRGAP